MAPRPAPFKESQLKRYVSLVLAALLITSPAAWCAPAAASAQSLGGSSVGGQLLLSSQTPSLTVSIQKSAAAIAPTGTIEVTVAAGLKAATRTLTVRLRIRRPNGRLVYQHTQTLTRLKAGMTFVRFTKSFSDLALREGRYPLEAAIVAGGLPPVTLTDRLFLIKLGRPPVSLVVVPRFGYSPMIDPAGRFVVDPATVTRARDEVTSLTGILNRDPQLKLSVSVPPLMLDEWRRITSGFKSVDPDGVVHDVPKNAPVTSTYAAALAALRIAVAGPRMELLDVPFADPDLEGLRSISGLADLKRHYDRAISIYQASVGATPVAGTAILGDGLPNAAVPIIATEKVGFVLLRPSALTVSRVPTASSGVYMVRGTRVKCLVLDTQASALLENPAATPEQLLDHLFTRLTSSTLASQPVIVSVRVGPGSRTDDARLERTLEEVARSGWVRFVSASKAARTRAIGTARLPTRALEGTPAPEGYWAEVAKARTYAIAFVDAVTEQDPDAEASMYAALVSESRYWAGPDQSWSLADRGRAFAAAALRSSQDVLLKVAVTSQNITLAASSGKVPLSIRNDSAKTLNVGVMARGAHASFPGGPLVRVALRPGDNYVTIPVDLGAAFADRLTVSVVSGDVTLAETLIEVRASYLNRLGLVATAVLVMLGLLFYIRRKARREGADT